MLAFAVVAVIATHSNDVPSPAVDEAVSRLTAIYTAKPDDQADRLAARVADDYAPATDAEIGHALELAARWEKTFDAHDRDEALEILERVTATDERATRATASLRNARRLSSDMKWSTFVVVPVGFEERDLPVLYIDGETSDRWVSGQPITTTRSVGVHRAHFRCHGHLCSRTVDLMVSPEDGKTHVIASSELRERLTTRPLALHYDTASTLGSRAAGDASAIAWLLGSENNVTAIVVMAEGDRIRLAWIGSKGPLGTLSTLPEGVEETARRLLDGDSEAAVTREPAGKPRVLITPIGDSPDLVSVQTTVDPKPTPTTQLCAAPRCTFYAPRGRLTMQFSDDGRGEDRQHVVDVTGDVEVTVHPAKRARVYDVGRVLLLVGLGSLAGTGLVYGAVYAAGKAGGAALGNGGSTSFDVPKWVGLGGSVAVVVGGAMMFTFKPFRVTVKPLVR